MLVQYVGLAQGIQGTCVAISAVPGTSLRSSIAARILHSFFPLLRTSKFGVLLAAGWLADRFRRDRVLKCCAVASCGELPHDTQLHGDPQSCADLTALTSQGLYCSSSKQDIALARAFSHQWQQSYHMIALQVPLHVPQQQSSCLKISQFAYLGPRLTTSTSGYALHWLFGDWGKGQDQS